MGAALKANQQAIFKDSLHRQHPGKILADFRSLLNMDETKFFNLRRLFKEYNDSLPSKKGRINKNDVSLLRCLVEVTINDMNRLRKSNPEQYLNYLDDDLSDFIRIRITRRSMCVMMANDGAEVSEKTVYNCITRIMAAGDSFILDRETDQRRFKKRKNADGTETLLWKHVEVDAEGHHTIIYNAQKPTGKMRGETILKISKKMLVWDNDFSNNVNAEIAENQPFSSLQKKNLPQTNDEYLNKNKIIKNNSQQAGPILEGESSIQFLKETSPIGSGDKRQRNEDGKNREISAAAVGVSGGVAAVSGANGAPVYEMSEYLRRIAEFDRFMANSQPDGKTEKYARFLYLMINDLIYPENTPWYIRVTEKQGISMIKGLLKATQLPLEYAYKYLATGVLKAQRFAEKHPEWKFQNIKVWLDPNNTYGFKQIILDEWMPQNTYNLNKALDESEAKRRCVLTHQQATQLAYKVIEATTVSHHSAGKLLQKNARRLIGYCKKWEISEVVTESALQNFLDLTKPVWTQVRLMAIYEKDAEWMAFEQEVQLARLMNI